MRTDPPLSILSTANGKLRTGALVVAALVVMLAAAPWPLTTLLAGAAALEVVRPLARRRGRGPLDAWATGIGVPVVSVLTVGLVLHLTVGLTRWTWALSLAAVALVALVLSPAPPDPAGPAPAQRRRPPAQQLGWAGAAVAVTAGALAVSVLSARGVEDQPLQLSVEPASLSTGTVSVKVASGPAAGPFDLVLDNGDQLELIHRGVTVEGDDAVTVPVHVPDGTRARILLSHSGQDLPIRSLIVDRTSTGDLS